MLIKKIFIAVLLTDVIHDMTHVHFTDEETKA